MTQLLKAINNLGEFWKMRCPIPLHFSWVKCTPEGSVCGHTTTRGWGGHRSWPSYTSCWRELLLLRVLNSNLTERTQATEPNTLPVSRIPSAISARCPPHDQHTAPAARPETSVEPRPNSYHPSCLCLPCRRCRGPLPSSTCPHPDPNDTTRQRSRPWPELFQCLGTSCTLNFQLGPKMQPLVVTC